MARGVFTPYSTVSAFTSSLPAWVPALEQERIASYLTYEQIYWNHPETFKLVVRGTENSPIYIPSGRIIVETMNRFFGKGLGFTCTPIESNASQVDVASVAFTSLFRRERMRSKFNTSKRYGLIRGDMVFHVVADPAKPQGSRLSLYEVDPASYFPVYSDTNLNRIEKIHLVDQFVNAQSVAMIRRQTYERNESGQIFSSIVEFKQDEFAKAAPKVDAVIQPPTPLHPSITAFPVYHIKNFDEPGNPYGSSEMRGLEVLMSAINQTVSDTDVALALEGLGVYATDSGAPVDDEGNPTDWIIGPGRVIERAQNFRRVTGVSSVEAPTKHIDNVWSFMKAAAGVPDIAIGKVDVQVAESGVALNLQMGPIMARADEKEELALDVLTQMLFDLKRWFDAYEGLNLDSVDVLPRFGDRLPVNRKQEIETHVAMVMTDPPIMSAATARERLAEKGIEFGKDEFSRIIQERQALAEAAGPVDPQADRLAEEAGLPVAPTDAGGSESA